MPFIIVALLLAAAIGAGASVAAQDALPGDTLWTFRTDINEKITETLAADGTAKADLHIAAIDSREKEAALLSATATLQPDVKADIETNITYHVHGAESQIANIRAKGDYAAAATEASKLQAVLAKQTSGIVDVSALLDEASALSAETSADVQQQKSQQ